MIIADKILYLRKKHNLTQEELADKLNVSRQSISKWESASSIPDITKIMAIADMFSVSVDYLLKDEIEYPDNEVKIENTHEHLVTIEEANDFLTATKLYANKIALGVLLCILSPITLIFLSTTSEDSRSWINISSEVSSIIGLVVLFAFVATAVSIFILSDAQMKPYSLFKKGEFDLSFGVSSIIKEKQNVFMPIRTKNLIISVLMFILGALPLLTVSLLNSSSTLIVLMLVLLIAVVAFGVYNLIIHETQKDAFEILLREGEFNRNSIENYKNHERIGGIYWPIVVAIYLGWSFYTGNWHITWIIWPISGLLFSAVMAIFVKK